MRARIFRRGLCVSAAVLGWCVSISRGADASIGVTYTITDLGTLGGTYSYGYSINNSGEITPVTMPGQMRRASPQET